MKRNPPSHPPTPDKTIASAAGKAQVTVSATAAAQVFRFCGLLMATEYNAHHAGLDKDFNAQTVNAMNTLLMAYAALQALVLETALELHPELYANRKGFRNGAIVEQFKKFLAADGRVTEPVPDVVAEIASNRVALTHSEPDNVRSAVLGKVISATDAARFAKEVRNVAAWLWQGKRPGAVASAFDNPNVFMT